MKKVIVFKYTRIQDFFSFQKTMQLNEFQVDAGLQLVLCTLNPEAVEIAKTYNLEIQPQATLEREQ